MTATVIFIEVGVVITLIVSLMSCVCFKTKPKNINVDPESMPQESLNNNKNLPVTTSEQENRPNGDIDHLDSVKMRNRTIPRELPALPPNNGHALSCPGSTGDIFYAIPIRHSACEVRLSDVDLDKSKVPTASQRSIDEIKIHTQSSSIGERIDAGLYDESNVYATARPSSSRYSSNLNDSPPPVPEKHFEQRESAVASTSTAIHPTLAASAVAGMADIPFITSPVRVASEVEINIRNRYSDEPFYDENPPNYTSISVREPLANIKAQTTCQRYEPEPTYSFVSDDSDKMYEEIHLDQRSVLPPAPPSVDSLRTVAQAQHSRQASSSSFVSDTTLSHSPTFEQNLSAGVRMSQATAEELSGMYSTVNKPKKARPEEEFLASGPAIEDMYAKVQKSISASTGARPRQTTNGQESIHAQSMFGTNSNSATKCDDNLKSPNMKCLIRRSSSKDDPNYEKILETPTGTPPDREPTSRHRPRRTYKSGLRRKGSDSGYETMPVGQSFADYETIGGGYNSDEEIVPGYEKVTSPPTYRGLDPNYETVDYDTVSAPAGRSVPEENPYWQIEQNREGEIKEPLYERINSRDDDSTDPNYEKVKTVSELSYGEASDPGYEQVGQSGTSSNVYEKMNDFDRALSSTQSDPGYEKIQENRLELRLEWNRDNVNAGDAIALPFRDGVGSTTPVDNVSIYNTVYDDYERQVMKADKTSFPGDLDNGETHHYYDERHDSLL